MRAVIIIFCATTSLLIAQQRPAPSLDGVLQMYVQAVGGEAAVDGIRTLEIHGTLHGRGDAMPAARGNKNAAARVTGTKVICYWEKPDKAVELRTSLLGVISEMGFDGSGAWFVPNAKGRKPGYDMREELETTANPLRYVHMKSLYPTVQVSPSENLESRPMDVLAAPNDSGATKFYFDRQTHFLVYLTETGITSNYYKRAIRFRDYRAVDAIQYPFRLEFTSANPEATTHEIKISQVRQNVEINSEQFRRPSKN